MSLDEPPGPMGGLDLNSRPGDAAKEGGAAGGGEVDYGGGEEVNIGQKIVEDIKKEEVQDNTRRVSWPTQAMSIGELLGQIGKLYVNSKPEYSSELQEALRILKKGSAEEWRILEEKWMTLEEEGTALEGAKNRYTHLFLDLRITQNLPGVGDPEMNRRENFEHFLSAIFFVAQGVKERPFQHAKEAMDEQNKIRRFEKLREIKDDDYDLVAFPVSGATTSEEAKTRKAAIILAIGVKNLCNAQHGTFYGPATSWDKSKKCQLGTKLLYHSYEILLQKGEKVLTRCDLSSGLRGRRN